MKVALLCLLLVFIIPQAQLADPQSVPPGSIVTQSDEVVFKSPYDKKQTRTFSITNASGSRMGWFIKITKRSDTMNGLEVHPSSGVLDPKESVVVTFSCDKYSSGMDRFVIEWTNTPNGASKQFRREWFQGDAMVRRKNLRIIYN
uniref:Major sperm protein n=1 Tax=Steinernema glaseri TaxID=37863 RepID=A0A1I7Y0Y3_9BILA